MGGTCFCRSAPSKLLHIRSVSALLGLNWPYRVIARQPIHYWESYGRSNRTGFYRRVSSGQFHPRVQWLPQKLTGFQSIDVTSLQIKRTSRYGRLLTVKNHYCFIHAMLASRKILSSDIITGLLYTRVFSSSSLLRSYSVARVHIFVLKDKLIQCIFGRPLHQTVSVLNLGYINDFKHSTIPVLDSL